MDHPSFALFATVVMKFRRDDRYPLIAASLPSRSCSDMCVNCLNLFDSTIVNAPPAMSRLAVKIDELYSNRFCELLVLLKLSAFPVLVFDAVLAFEFRHNSISSMSFEGNTRNSTSKD